MIAFEKHYRVKDLATLWGVSPQTIRGLFANESGVLRIANHGTGNRRWVVLSIPESIAVRVHERLSVQATQINRAPLRVVRLRDFRDRIAKQPRTVIKLRAGGAAAKRPDTRE